MHEISIFVCCISSAQRLMNNAEWLVHIHGEQKAYPGRNFSFLGTTSLSVYIIVALCICWIADIIQMMHDSECDMLIYMSRSRNVNTRAQPSCPLCIICFVASLTKIRLNSIKKLHFTGTERCRNYVTTSATSVKPRPPWCLSQWTCAGFVYIECHNVT